MTIGPTAATRRGSSTSAAVSVEAAVSEGYEHLRAQSTQKQESARRAAAEAEAERRRSRVYRRNLILLHAR